ncbi:aminotransferase class I/II-fold pyridoxal phosphate-dependent enzyme [Streptomyces sp. AJS327]|uniref:aminotransferase class I/II-fold pyridoxal phosphate-dependent enzyme n=1 Tax=Streptomyces sp. AJS327 TaxID=2545265 RepID=UPI0015DE4707|nr:aminotransferase class I/II-fold pyridoxal phosphate-dependent enzyme [Streptomyces sp. AJS327]MBA0052200.1 aminotransferase class I/II-fold pyridoxal phosphate-dependent enzyme [Streptomyces sp. AJS327]
MRATEHDGRTRPVALAACGYWERRGMPTAPGQVAVAPGAPLLLLAVLAADAAAREAAGRPLPGNGGGVLLPRPCPAWYAPPARLLGRPVLPVPVPAECGGVPDPVALAEAVRRAAERGVEPGALLLSVADDITGTAAPPELLHEVCEAATDAGLLVVSDETWRDTSHGAHDTLIVSPGEMLHGGPHESAAVVLADLGEEPEPGGPTVGIVRCPPAADPGPSLGARVRAVLDTLRGTVPVACADAAAEVLAEAGPARERRAAAGRTRGELATALYERATAAGALCRPPRLGSAVYADLEPLRPRLAGRGVVDAAGLEAELVRHLGPYAEGGHRFGDDPHALRVRLHTGLLAAPGGRRGGRSPGEPRSLGEPGVEEALNSLESVLAALTDGSPPR